MHGEANRQREGEERLADSSVVPLSLESLDGELLRVPSTRKLGGIGEVWVQVAVATQMRRY